MKKSFLLLAILPSLFSLSGCSETYSPIDYSKEENWHSIGKGGIKEVDTFYIYPTVCMRGGTVTEIEDNRQNLEAYSVRTSQCTVYDQSTNLYMPYYRQCSIDAMSTCGETTLEISDFLSKKQGYNDLEDSLDYYFKHFNNNKPFILAGHSQGSCQIFNILTKYMQKHPQYLERMVAAYGIGFGFSKTEIAKYPNLKFATGETDTKCIISYNTAGPAHGGRSLLHDSDSFAINPINWKTDDTYASIEENLGSLINKEVVAGVSDAKVDVAKGYLVSNADSKYEATGSDDIFGTHCFHGYDYGFYYNNLIDNVSKRINSFLKK